MLALLQKPSTCYLATLSTTARRRVTQTWVDTDGEHVIINSVQDHVKTRNIERDRAWPSPSPTGEPLAYFQVRGRVVEVTTDARRTHRHAGQKYLGKPYPWFAAATRYE